LTARDTTRALGQKEIEDYDLAASECAPAGDGTFECNVVGWKLMAMYLDQVQAENPELALDDDHQIGYELLESVDPRSGKVDQVWRSYYLWRPVELSGSAVTDSRVYWNPTTN